MNAIAARGGWLGLFWCAVVCGGAVDAHAQAATEIDPAVAEDALVNLGTLWNRVSGGVPLPMRYVDTYLAREATPVARAAPVAPDLDWGSSLVLAPATMSAAREGSLRLPIKLVSASDAREFYRRQAFLSLYVRKHDAVRAVWQSGRVPSDAKMSAEDMAQHGRQAAAAHVELFLIERIALGEGETQEQKCAGYQRASAHARALGLEAGAGSGPAAAPRPIADADLPPAWRSLYGAARAHHAAQHAPFARALALFCAQGAEVTPTQTREHLELALTQRLERNIDSFFAAQLVSIQTVQEAFTELSAQNDTFVPRKAIADLYRQVIDARSVYDIVYKDTFGLTSRLTKLTEATARLTERLAANPAQGAFPNEARELTRLRGELTSFLVLAKSIAAIPFPSAADRQALSPCARLPDTLEGRTSGIDLAPLVDTCIAAATALREKLFRASDVPPERALFLRHLRSLSHAFLTANTW